MEGIESLVERGPPPVDPVLCTCYGVALENECRHDVESHIVQSLSDYVSRVLPDAISDEVDCTSFTKALEDLVATNASLQLQLSTKACDKVGLTSSWAERMKRLSTSPLRLLSSDDPVRKALGLGRTLALLCAASSLDSRARQLRQGDAQKEFPGYLATDVLQPLLTLSLRECSADVLLEAVRSMAQLSKTENVTGGFPLLHLCKVLHLINS